MSDQEWIELMTESFGRQTINELRAAAGLEPVKNGNQVYVDWLKAMAGLPLRPQLRVVPYE